MALATIRRRLKRISVSHRLPHVRDGHKCRNDHGHNYHVWIECSGSVDKRTGMLVDTEVIDAVWVPLHSMLDHRQGGLNSVPGLENPTTEVFAAWIHERFQRALADFTNICMIKVEVMESEDSIATYSD